MKKVKYKRVVTEESCDAKNITKNTVNNIVIALDGAWWVLEILGGFVKYMTC